MAQTEHAHERTASTDQRTSWSWRKLFGNAAPPAAPDADTARPGLARRLSRKVVPELRRPGTFKRQQSELRHRLEPTKPNTEERRTVSMDRRCATSVRDASVVGPPRLSAPELLEKLDAIEPDLNQSKTSVTNTQKDDAQGFVEVTKEASNMDTASIATDDFDELILEELETRWILNLSMHFRDKSQREKFFVTFAETPTHWRRVTISLDYRNAPPGSLEEELQRTRFQRDKSARIYEAIRESLPDIQFYDTVTNLKLQTEHDRLHVHVVEDLSEIISYPPVRSISHLKCRRVREDELVFDSHLSGFVYKVSVNNEVFIKKEIPGPDTVDEFLYEINALHQLTGSHSVIQFGGVVLDNNGEYVKGLLISFAEKGALIDVIYDGEGSIPWHRRERWAKQIVQGLSEIHEAGFVQGDFTLSNIVIDGDDNAKIIDINRRGCPVGWEPPEVTALIDSSQRISMYIGVKSDLYQLGMVLYALATQQDEPEAHRPFILDCFPPEIPNYYLDLCHRCLNDDPRRRSQAEVLLTLFPEIEEQITQKYEHPIPIVVDARHIDETRYDETILPHEANYNSRKLSSLYSPGSAPRIYAETDVTDESEYFPRRGRSPPAPRRLEMDPWDVPLPHSNGDSDHLNNSHDILVVEDEGPVSVLAMGDGHIPPYFDDVCNEAEYIQPIDLQKQMLHQQAQIEASTIPEEQRKLVLNASKIPQIPEKFPDVNILEHVPHSSLPLQPAGGEYKEPQIIASADREPDPTSIRIPPDNFLAGVGGAYSTDIEKHPANLEAEFTTLMTEAEG